MPHFVLLLALVCSGLVLTPTASSAQPTARPLPPAPGTVPLRSRVRHYAVRGGVTPRFASPSGFDPTELANVGARLAAHPPELWSCTRRAGAAIDPTVAASLPASFHAACFYEGYETLTVIENDESTGFARLHGGGYVPSGSLVRRRVASQFHGSMLVDRGLPSRIARQGDSVVFDEAADPVPGVRSVLPPPEAFLATVQEGERWVYVERDAQVLVAYVGRTPVMITLVTTGRRGFATSLGEYRIVRKRPVGSMRDYDPGRGDRPYFIAGIPDIQYFNAGQAFHAAFWHDRFGTPGSHGCVNLALADAQWLFDFTDEVPEGAATRGLPRGAVTSTPTPWPRGRDGYGNRVFVHGAPR